MAAADGTGTGLTLRRHDARILNSNGPCKCQAAHTFDFDSLKLPPATPFKEKFRTLRVMNEDRTAQGGGMNEHGHADFEIFSIVLQGTLRAS